MKMPEILLPEIKTRTSLIFEFQLLLVQSEPAIADTAPPGMTPNAEDFAVLTF